MRQIYRHITKLTHWVIPACVSLLTIMGSPVALATDNAFTKQVRYITTRNLGIPNPIGLTYSSQTQSIFVGQLDWIQDNNYQLTGLSMFEDILEPQVINADITNPANISFDLGANRLLLLNTENSEDVLITIKAGDNGNLNKLERFDASSFSLGNPQGMTVDPISGSIFILDASGPSIIQIEPDLAGRFDNPLVTEIDLSSTDSIDLQGIALNPSNGHIYVLDVIQQNLFELNLEGQVQSTRNLSKLNLSNPQSMTFAPSGDLTDDDSKMNLYIINNGLNPGIAELSLIPSKLASKTPNTPETVKVSATMAFKVKTSQYNPPSPDPSGIGYLPESNSLLISDGEVGEEPVGSAPVIFEGFNLFETNIDGDLINTTSASTRDFLDDQGLSSVETADFSDEPTGISETNPTNNHIFISDDDVDKIFEVDPGSDGQYGTADDEITSFSTRDFSPKSEDPEGVAYAAPLGDLFIADGINNEIYRVSPGADGRFDHTSDNEDTHFDTEQHGLKDPEGIAYFPATGNLLVIGDPNDTLFEFTPSGDLVREIDFSEATDNNLSTPAGLALAPLNPSNPNTTCIYVVDRAVDNNSESGENDGLLFKMCFPTGDKFNQAPSVNAGPDQTIFLLNIATLDATAGDDGLPTSPGSLTFTWKKISGPGVVGFSSANKEDTLASFSRTGTYVFRLTADDGDLDSNDDITITVLETGSDGESGTTIERRVSKSSDDAEEDESGTVKTSSSDLELVFDGGDNQTVGLRFNDLSIPPGATILSAYLQFKTDETTPRNTTNLTIEGEDTANAKTFRAKDDNISSRPRTSASKQWEPEPWTSTGEKGLDQRSSNISAIIQEIVNLGEWNSGNSMVLIITGTGERTAESFDGDKNGAPLLHIEYSSKSTASNKTPTVNAGSDQSISLSEDATLNGTVNDDGLPSPSTLTTQWTKVSGPGTVTFDDIHAVDTSASFSESGTYVLQLTADDSDLDSNDKVTVTVSDIADGSITMIERQVSTSSDDAEEDEDGNVKISSSDLELVHDGGDNQIVGMRFNNLTIPRGATIVYAHLQFQTDETTPQNATSLTIEGEATGSAKTFTSDDNNISERSRTKASTHWNPEAWTSTKEAGPDQQSPNISAIIQEIVNLDWNSGNSIALIISGTGERTAESYNGDKAGAPILHIEYSTGPVSNQAPFVNAGANQTITIPTEAVLNGTVSDDGLPNPSALTIQWTKVSGPGTVTFDDDNAIDTTASFSESGTYVLQLSADDGDLDNSDEVTIAVNGSTGGGGEIITIEKRVTTGSDDAEERDSGRVELTSSDLELVFDGGGNQTVGIRFNDLPIPAGATITNAYMQFTTDETTPQNTTGLTIEGEAVADAATFISAHFNISSRPRTTTSTSWSPIAWTSKNEAGLAQRTPNISGIIQEIVNSGWTSGNSMVLLITGTGERTAESYNGDKSAAPLLHVEFTLP